MMADPAAEIAKMIENFEAKTGRAFETWLADARGSGLDRHKPLVDWLKAEHGLGHGYANLVAHKTLASDSGSIDDGALVEAMFAGPKAAVRPIYDAVMARVDRLGAVELAPKKGYVSLRRSKQFALVQPSTATRVDLGLTLKGVAPDGRMEAAGSWNAMVTHRVRLTEVAQVDDEVATWLRQAWEAAA
jgi:hypothetical protein